LNITKNKLTNTCWRCIIPRCHAVSWHISTRRRLKPKQYISGSTTECDVAMYSVFIQIGRFYHMRWRFYIWT